MTGFHSYNKFKKSIKDLKQIYDFTYHLYIQEHEVIIEKLKHKESKVVTVSTSVGTIDHSLNSLFHHTKENYPDKLRQLILINLITSLEVFFTDTVKEINSRDIEPFKTEEKIEFGRNELLSYPTINRIERELLLKDVRKITSGGLVESKKYFFKKFGIDFSQLSVSFNEVQEIHERRHIQVHQNGLCDAHYAKRYPAFGLKAGDSIKIDHNYLIKALETLKKFGQAIIEKALVKYPRTKRATVNKKGLRNIEAGDVKIMIEFEILRSNFDLENELFLLEISDTKFLLRDFIVQYTCKDKRCNLFIASSQWTIKRIMWILKEEEKINILNTMQIHF